MEKKDKGQINIEGREIKRIEEEEIRKVSRRIGMVLKNLKMIQEKKDEKNIEMKIKIEGMKKEESIKRVEEIMEMVGI